MKTLPFLRELTPQESTLLTRLLSAEFPGCVELRRQFEGLRARSIDENGSLAFLVQNAPPAEVKGRIPVEGYCEDSDGVMIHFLLHVLNGSLSELEIFKEDNSRIFSMPTAEWITLMVL